MKDTPLASILPDGRLALLHGPIHATVRMVDTPQAVAKARARVVARFQTLLAELCEERSALHDPDGAPVSETGQRMAAAIAPHRPHTFVTPMAAVAGAVADTLCHAAGPLRRVIVNNGGDIAMRLAPGERASARIATPAGETVGTVRIASDDGVGGLATSGAGGRSLSLGIADAVTVLAGTAAAADAAATLIANAVDLPGHPAISRAKACDLVPGSDLGDRPVVSAVGPLSAREVAAALQAGAAAANHMRARGTIIAAALSLRGATVLSGDGLAGLFELGEGEGHERGLVNRVADGRAYADLA
ncbi:MAG: UPF0280 family protein [Pseudomonadota bacterium]